MRSIFGYIKYKLMFNSSKKVSVDFVETKNKIKQDKFIRINLLIVYFPKISSLVILEIGCWVVNIVRVLNNNIILCIIILEYDKHKYLNSIQYNSISELIILIHSFFSTFKCIKHVFRYLF